MSGPITAFLFLPSERRAKHFCKFRFNGVYVTLERLKKPVFVMFILLLCLWPQSRGPRVRSSPLGPKWTDDWFLGVSNYC